MGWMLLASIPDLTPLQESALKEAVDHFHLSETTSFTLLSGGLTRARPYLFTHNNQKLVLRFCDLAVSNTIEIRQNEIKALEVGASLNLAPPCLFTDTESTLFVTSFLTGKALHNPTSAELTSLGRMIRTLHETDADYPEGRTLVERLQRHHQKGLAAHTAYPTHFATHIQNITQQSRSLVPCHGDLNPSNILIGDSMQLIDWTLACKDDPFSDLGYFCLLANLTPTQEIILLESYLNRAPEPADLAALNGQKATTALLISAIWFRFSENVEEKTYPRSLRIAALDAELHSPTLKSTTEYLQKWALVDFNIASKKEVRAFALSFYKTYLSFQQLP